MIKYGLKCENAHVFEAWFKNSATYDEQASVGDVVCVVCGSTSVEKAPMAPAVPRKGRNTAPRRDEIANKEAENAAAAMIALREIRKTVEENCDYVGPRFAEEARKIHYGEIERRGIYGEATPEESNELREEGVDIAEVPWLPTTDA
ncbi:DUF1178 family protein [Sneathiella litorea]|uniref:DUF1178 family protein n=1 Tax=Sneathiella litorea TaxID=2606216 RepID=A0A6L8W225_9PROT|nr:DUF1178 family protein [Sneathiella litorea]MZR29025.1 DUF1178 family protein [Sneathiella litorea]